MPGCFPKGLLSVQAADTGGTGATLRWPAPSVDALPQREAVIIRARLRGATLGEAGARYGISRERTRQIEKLAIGRLRAPLGGR